MSLSKLFGQGLSANTKAPEFCLKDQNEKQHCLADYKGQWLLLYFYPKDLSPGCTAEACSFRDKSSDYEAHGIKVLGISTDSSESHKSFAEAHNLNFPILADTDRQVAKNYEVLLPLGIANRVSFLINPEAYIHGNFKWIPWKNYASTLESKILEMIKPS